MDAAQHLAHGDLGGLGVVLLIGGFGHRAPDQGVELLQGGVVSFLKVDDVEGLLGFQGPQGIADAGLGEDGVGLLGVHHRLAEVGADVGLRRHEEAGAHHHPVQPGGQGGVHGAAVAHAPGSHHREGAPLGGQGPLDDGAHPGHPRVAAPLVAHDAHRVAAHFLGGVGKAGVGDLVHHQAAGPFQGVHQGGGGAAGGLHDLHLLLHHRLEEAFDGPVGLGVRQQGEVDGEGPVGQGLELLDGGLKVLRGGIGGHIDGTQPPGVGHGGSQAGLGQPLHGPLDDGVLDAEEFGDTGFHGSASCSWCGMPSW